VLSAVWTTRLLSAYLERVTGHHTGIETVRIHLHRLGYVCKPPTWSLKRKSRADVYLQDEVEIALHPTPAYDPESNRIEWLWRSLRRAVTHIHTRHTLPPLLDDADGWARTISPTEILRQIGSPFADTVDPTDHQAIAHAA
jgi:hypothetical protein